MAEILIGLPVILFVVLVGAIFLFPFVKDKLKKRPQAPYKLEPQR